MKNITKNTKIPHYPSGLLLLLLFNHAVVLAGDLVVNVKEKGSGVIIEGAMVVIDGGVVYGETLENGIINFSDITSSSQIKILATGYETLVASIPPGQENITFYIEPLIMEGESLEVIKDRIIEKTSKITLSATELLKTAGSGGDPLVAITALPGITAAKEGSAKVYMRGSNGNDNITWVNNTPVGYLYHFGGFKSTINPLLIEDINVFLGGFPVQYGDALGGVVDAKLRAPKNDRMNYQFDISTVNASFLVEGPIGKSGKDSFFVSGRRSYIDLILSPSTFNRDSANDEDADQFILVPRFYDFQALYRRQLKGGYIDTYFFSAGDEFEFKFGKKSINSDPLLAGQVSEKISYKAAGVTWKQNWNSRWNSISSLAVSQDRSADRIGGDAKGNPFFANVEEKSLYFQSEFRWQTREQSLTSFGVSTGYSKAPVKLYAPLRSNVDDPGFDITTQPKFRFNKTLTAAEFSPYIKHREQWTDKFSTQFGLRYTNIEVAGGFHTHKFSPRFALEYKLTPDTLLSAAWGKYIQMPDGEQIIKTLGNPALLMTEAEHRILGIEHRINSLYTVKAEVYQKPMKNLVITLDENLPPKNQVNKGTGEAYGFDIFLKRKPNQGKTGWVSFSWAKSTRKNEITGVTRDFIGDQPLALTAVWGQPFGDDWKRWDWSVKAQARSGRPYTKTTGRFREDSNDPESRWIPEFGKYNAERLPNYYRVDLRIAREILFNRSKLKVYLDVQNVTFARNIVGFEYGDEYENIDNPTVVSSLPFFPFIGMEMEF